MANKQEQTPKQAKTERPISAVCTPDKLSRCDYFSDTYTSVLTVNGEKKLMDITHISLPFKPNREKAVREFFGIDKEGMVDIYSNLALAITNHAHTTTFLNEKKNTKSIITIYKIYSDKKKMSRGSDVYMVTDHLRPLIETYFNGETTVKQIVNFGARLSKMVADIHQSGDESVTLRVIDPEQIFVAEDGNYVFGCFHYAYNSRSNKPPITVPETAPLHVHPKVIAGEAGNEGTDMYSIASMLWSLLNGDGFDKPTPTGTPPKYAPETILPILEMGFQADPEMFAEFKKRLLKLNKELSKPENHGDVKVPVPAPNRCIEEPIAAKDFGEESEVIAAPETPAEEVVSPTPVEAPQEPNTEETPAEKPYIIQSKGNAYAIGKQHEAVPQSIPEAIAEKAPVEESEPEYANTTTYMQEEPAAPEKEKKPFSLFGHGKKQNPAENAIEEEQPVDLDEAYFAEDTVKVLDTRKYVEEAESDADVVPDTAEEQMEFFVTYSKPQFFFDQLFIAASILIIIGAVIYASLSQHLISLW